MTQPTTGGTARSLTNASTTEFSKFEIPWKFCLAFSQVLTKLGHRADKREIDLMIWEVDDDLDHHVSWDEFLVMYQRCISDSTGMEPRNLFNLAQFLMYDKEFTGTISVEQTLQILFVRYGREKLDAVPLT